jgi:predicted nucleotidyltransferase
MMRERPDPAQLRAKLGDLLAAHAEIDFAYLFGSFADGAQYHDVDVAVFLRPAPAPAMIFDYAMDLSVQLTLALHVAVDVHVLNGAPRGFQHAVLQGQQLLVRDEERLTDFVEEVGTEVMEFAHLADLYLREVLT